MLDRLVVHWRASDPQVRNFHNHALTSPHHPHPLQNLKIDAPTRHLRRALKAILTALLFTSLVFTSYTLLFGLARSLVLPVLLKLPVVSMLLRPFCAHFLRGSWTVMLLPRHLSLVWRTFLLGLSTVSSWEFAESLFDERVQEVRPLTASHSHSHSHIPTLRVHPH